MENGVERVEIKGRKHRVVLPGFAEREDLFVAYYSDEAKRPRRRERVLFAALALSVPSLKAGTVADYEAAQLDPVVFGSRVYNRLRSADHSRAELLPAAVKAFEVIATNTFPREAEVTDREDFTEAAEARPT